MTGMHASHAERKDELHAFPSLSLQEEIIPEDQTSKKEKENKKEKHKNERKKN
jgi:hypothetical protein